jgi:Tfp pilus assembly protein PilF
MHLKSSVSKDPSAKVKYHLAMAYLRTGDRAQGARTLSEALSLDPNLPEAAAAQQLLSAPVVRH